MIEIDENSAGGRVRKARRRIVESHLAYRSPRGAKCLNKTTYTSLPSFRRLSARTASDVYRLLPPIFIPAMRSIARPPEMACEHFQAISCSERLSCVALLVFISLPFIFFCFPAYVSIPNPSFDNLRQMRGLTGRGARVLVFCEAVNVLPNLGHSPSTVLLCGSDTRKGRITASFLVPLLDTVIIERPCNHRELPVQPTSTKKRKRST